MSEQADVGSAQPLILSHYCLPSADFSARVHAAAANGVSALGLNLHEYRRLRAEGRSDDELLDILVSGGQRIVELEALSGWSHSGDTGSRSRRAEDELMHVADVFGATYLQVVGPHEGDFAGAALRFAALCRRAAAHHVRIGLEFLPFTNISDARTALRLVTLADEPNGGVCADAWHFFRGNPDWETLSALPVERLFGIQLNDGPIRPENPDYLPDCLHNRRAPGDGEFDLVRFIRGVRRGDWFPAVSIEVISDALSVEPPVEAVRRMVLGTRAVLDAARA